MLLGLGCLSPSEVTDVHVIPLTRVFVDTAQVPHNAVLCEALHPSQTPHRTRNNMPPSRVHLVRHGQGQHNLEPLETNRLVHDAQLTDTGIQRCKMFGQEFPQDIHIDLVCASPMWRTIQTASYCFEKVIPQTELKKILLLPDAQETTAAPCDVGSPVSVITKGFGDLVDTHMVMDDWTSKRGKYATDAPALRARARALRRWLRARKEQQIVVVSHGAILDYIVQEKLDKNGVFQGTRPAMMACKIFASSKHG